jgi:hypothetical protein
MLKPILTPRDIAERWHRFMPDDVRQALKGRGIASTVIDRQLLGWNGKQAVIPVFGESRRDVLGFRYANLPHDASEKPEVRSDDGVRAELYGRETLARTPHRLVICEGEFDRLLLESRGFAAVAVPPCTFVPEWVNLFKGIENVFICFDCAVESDIAALKVQAILPNASIAHLPAAVGGGGTISDFFLQQLHTNHDFEIVLAGAVSPDGEPSSSPQLKAFRPRNKSQQRRAGELKKRVRLHDVAFEYMNLQAAGGRLVGHCPFHDDSSRSFSVYPETDTYRCSVCCAEGDVVRFLMDKESMTFGQALEALEGFSITHELYPS